MIYWLLAIISLIIVIYLLGVLYAFTISYFNYTNNINKVKNSENSELLMDKIKENNKWKIIFKPIWYSWLTVYVWYKKNIKVDSNQ